MHDNTSPINVTVALQRLEGNRTLWTNLIRYFLEDAPQLMEELTLGLEQTDCEIVERTAHSLRGLASAFEAVTFVSLTRDLEIAARQRNPALLPATGPVVAAEFTRVVAALQAELSGNS